MYYLWLGKIFIYDFPCVSIIFNEIIREKKSESLFMKLLRSQLATILKLHSLLHLIFFGQLIENKIRLLYLLEKLHKSSTRLLFKPLKELKKLKSLKNFLFLKLWMHLKLLQRITNSIITISKRRDLANALPTNILLDNVISYYFV